MRNRLEAYKPAATAKVHLLLAALMWTVVGALLLFFGARWVLSAHVSYGPPALAAALAAGVLKARYVLARTAQRMVERILTRGDGRCLGGFLSLRSWALVALMSVSGRFLRGMPLPRAIVGVIYSAVGTALLVGGVRIWQAWHHHETRP